MNELEVAPGNPEDRPDKSLQSADPLGESLHNFRMNGLFYSCAEFTAPWGVTIPPLTGKLIFHVVLAGQCWLEVEGGEPQLLQQGDFALVPHGEGHALLSANGVEGTSLFDIPKQLVSDRYEMIKYGGDGAATSIICGVMRFDHPAAHQLVRLLPRMIYVQQEHSLHFEWMQSTLRLMASEAQELQPGGETIITRLADIFVIQAIRTWLGNDPTAQTGWLGALRDPQIGHAIVQIQRDPARDWSVSTLANEVAMSRSAFAARFKELVGESPIQYMTRWRMSVARTWLQEENVSNYELAERLGYQSEAAFSRAFKRIMGVSTSAIRRQLMASPA